MLIIIYTVNIAGLFQLYIVPPASWKLAGQVYSGGSEVSLAADSTNYLPPNFYNNT